MTSRPGPDPHGVAACFFLWVFAALIAFCLQGCAGQVYPHAPLLKQIVRMRAGHDGPTHQVCSEKDWKGVCKKWDLVEYNFLSAEVRKQFVDLEFICKIGGSRYKIDTEQARFVRYTWKRPCWLCEKKPEIEKEIPYPNTALLYNGATYCYSVKGYPNGLKQ